MCQGNRNKGDAKRESIPGAWPHDEALQPKESPRTKISLESGIEVQSMPHLLKNNKIRILATWRFIVSYLLRFGSYPRAHEVFPLPPLSKRFFILGGAAGVAGVRGGAAGAGGVAEATAGAGGSAAAQFASRFVLAFSNAAI